MVNPKAWNWIGRIGAGYIVLTGIVIIVLGVTTAASVVTYQILIYFFPDYLVEILTYLSYISPTLAAFSFGPLAPVFGLQGASSMIVGGIIIEAIGWLASFGALLTRFGIRAGAILMAFSGFAGFLFFNLGGLLALVAGVALWHEA